MGPSPGPQGKLEGLCVGSVNNCFGKFVSFFNGPGNKAIFIAELSRAKRASGAPWVRKFGKLSIR